MELTMKLKALFLSLLAFACRAKEPAYVVGGLYSTPHEDGKYAVIKILKIDPEGVHLRMYSNTFAERPHDVDESKLYMAGVDHKPDEALGMGHAPISKSSFATWGAELIKVVSVREDELEGYKMWVEAKGGYF